ncbi:hypothetical protein EON65_46800 [archaeon]|nr:MAG: hypothetical protein EON65_46800 [archaeon]
MSLGEDDLFGEDDHMTHHYSTGTYFKDLPTYQKTKMAEWAKHKASVFRTLSIVELSIFILFGLWEKLADYYVDYTGECLSTAVYQRHYTCPYQNPYPYPYL